MQSCIQNRQRNIYFFTFTLTVLPMTKVQQGTDESLPRQEDCLAAARKFGIYAKKIRGDIPLAGSPERSAFRTAVQNEKNELYILESVFPLDIQRKEQIARSLDLLAKNHLQGIVPYLPSPNGGHLVCDEHGYWLMSAYVPGEPLDRPGYAFEGWRGKAFADFLLSLKKKAAPLSIKANGPFFSIASYAAHIMEDLKQNDPGFLPWFQPFFQQLETSFFPGHDALPRRFCHGDFHPVNMIWGKDTIKAVIDWEFSGIKPEGYDLANLLGCLGMEHPHALTGELVLSCVQTLRRNDFLSQESWDSLLDFILAIRFAWLSEWLRRKDTEMIEMERTYMKILQKNTSYLKEIWGI